MQHSRGCRATYARMPFALWALWLLAVAVPLHSLAFGQRRAAHHRGSASCHMHDRHAGSPARLYWAHASRMLLAAAVPHTTAAACSPPCISSHQATARGQPCGSALGRSCKTTQHRHAALAALRLTKSRSIAPLPAGAGTTTHNPAPPVHRPPSRRTLCGSSPRSCSALAPEQRLRHAPQQHIGAGGHVRHRHHERPHRLKLQRRAARRCRGRRRGGRRGP